MNKHNPISNTYRLLIVVGTIIIILFNTMKDQYALFILVVLVLLANMQVRNTLNKQSFFVLSIVVDCVFTFYLYSSFSYYAVLFLLVTLIDSLLRSNDKVYHLVLLISVTYGFSLNYVDRFDIGEIICLFYLFVLLFLVHLRKELNDKVEVESLNEKLRLSHYELELTRNRLKEYSKSVEKTTLLEERNRISRDLHDSIGHNLTGVLLQIDLAIQLLERDNKKAEEILKSAYQNVNSGIEEVRHIVRKLRPIDYQTHQSSLKELIEEFKEKTKVEVIYKISGMPYDLLPSIETVIYRNTQEALTNALRHGKATQITVQLIYKLDQTEIIVIDNGMGCKDVNKGFGLSGMEERIELIGGKISYKSDHGFLIHMIFPKKEG